MDDLAKLVALAKSRGFVFPSAEIYEGLRSAYDYGPLGVELLKNIKDAWWADVVRSRPDVVGLDAAIITSPKVWETSGHAAGFSDPLSTCSSCKGRFRADQLEEEGVCPACKTRTLSPAQDFNLMFKTQAGALSDSASTVFLRPETAQGTFVNFANVARTTRKRLPFGIAQVGKSFRNEITPSNFVFRTREFEQMELEFFVRPEDADEWFSYWVNERFSWYTRHGIPEEMLRLEPHAPEDLAHYSAATTDVEFRYPWGWGELEGVANRTDFDLTAHAAATGQDLAWEDPSTREKVMPYVIEPAAGATRAFLAFLLAAYREEEVAGRQRVVLALHPRLAPVKVAVLPLMKKGPQVDKALAVFSALSSHFAVDFDSSQEIGRRYRRQDEVGTPWCVTVDAQTLLDGTLTLRDRDTMSQERLTLDEIEAAVRRSLTPPR